MWTLRYIQVKVSYIQVVAKVYTSGSSGIYKWKLRYIQVDAKVYASES